MRNMDIYYNSKINKNSSQCVLVHKPWFLDELSHFIGLLSYNLLVVLNLPEAIREMHSHHK